MDILLQGGTIKKQNIISCICQVCSLLNTLHWSSSCHCIVSTKRILQWICVWGQSLTRNCMVGKLSHWPRCMLFAEQILYTWQPCITSAENKYLDVPWPHRQNEHHCRHRWADCCICAILLNSSMCKLEHVKFRRTQNTSFEKTEKWELSILSTKLQWHCAEPKATYPSTDIKHQSGNMTCFKILFKGNHCCDWSLRSPLHPRTLQAEELTARELISLLWMHRYIVTIISKMLRRVKM